jgi:hypothetical protein
MIAHKPEAVARVEFSSGTTTESSSAGRSRIRIPSEGRSRASTDAKAPRLGRILTADNGPHTTDHLVKLAATPFPSLDVLPGYPSEARSSGEGTTPVEPREVSGQHPEGWVRFRRVLSHENRVFCCKKVTSVGLDDGVPAPGNDPVEHDLLSGLAPDAHELVGEADIDVRGPAQVAHPVRIDIERSFEAIGIDIPQAGRIRHCTPPG